MSRYYLHHARRFGIPAALHYAAWRALDRVLGYAPYRCLVLPSNAAMDLPPLPPGIAVRQLEIRELARFALDPRYDLGESFLSVAQSEAYGCVAAFAGDSLAAYAFSSIVPTDIDQGFRFLFPHGWTYHFKAFTLPAWRGKHLHAHLTKMRRRIAKPGTRGAITIVAAANYPSSRSVERLGYRPFWKFAIFGRHGNRRLGGDPGGQRAAHWAPDIGEVAVTRR